MTGPVIKPKWNNLGARLLTAIIVVLICVAPFYIGGYVWALLVALFSARMMYEWVRMTDLEASESVIPLAIAIAGLLIALLYAVQGLPIWAFGAVLVTAIIASVERLRRGSAFWTVLGMPYIIIPAIVIILLRGDEVGFDTRGFTQVTFIILIVIAADVGAYFGGSSIGGPKLAPTLSPNKTWSGAISGFLLACAVGAIVGLFIGLPIWMSVALAAPIVILSVFGDLFESAVKRKIGVKDTGMLLPGHGGLLDRLDSLMAAIVGGAILFAFLGDNWPIG